MDACVLEQDSERSTGLIRTLYINRPQKRNALDAQTLTQLTQALKKADADPRVLVLILSATGEQAFCAGADLTELIQAPAQAMSGVTAQFCELFLLIDSLKKPLIIAVNGTAVGGGLGLVLAGDLVVVAAHAKLGTPEIRRGLFPFIISRFLYDSMPHKVANEIMLLGETLSAQRAQELGIINAVVEGSKVMDVAMGWAQQMADTAPSVVGLARRAVRQQGSMNLTDALLYLKQQLEDTLALPETSAMIAQFLNKEG